MLIGYKFNNFCSFHTDSEFSMEAPTGKVKSRFPDNFTSADGGYDLLKTAVIVGENAGGKSNFISSLRFVKSLMEANSQVQSVAAYVNSFSFLTENRPVQRFEFCFLSSQNHIYKYQLAIDSLGIVNESLYKQAKRKAVFTAVFEIRRDNNDIFRNHAGHAKELEVVLRSSNNSNGLYVSKLALLGNTDAVETLQWFQTVLLPSTVPNDSNGDPAGKDSELIIMRDDRFMDIFRMVDYSICSIEVDEDKPYSKTRILRKDTAGNEIRRELQQDSAGVRDFFAWAVQIFRVVYGNCVVFADEMDRVLNPILSEKVVAYVNGMEHRGQFVFSTHNVLHLNLKTYMKEQIYFVTKNRESLSSELYSLADFPEVRYETAKVYEFYMKGVLGGTSFE